MADMTATTMAGYLPEVWSTLATITYRTNTVNVPLLDHRWEPEIGVGRGDTVDIPAFTQNVRTDVTERSVFGTGATLTFNANTETPVQLKVDTMAYDAYRYPAEMNAQKMAMYDSLLTDGIGQALAAYIDYDISSDTTNGFDAFTAIGTDNVDVTDDVVLEGETVLNTYNAPLPGRFTVITPATRASLMKIDIYRNSLYKGAIGGLDGAKGAGYLGNVYTLDFYMSNNLAAGTSGAKNFVGHTEAIAIATQKGVTMLRDINIEDGIFYQTVGYLVYGFKQVKANFGRELDGK